MADVAVDPADLRGAAAQVLTVADRVARSAAGPELAVPRQRGWRSSLDLAEVAGGWAEHLRDVAAGLDELAADLHALADLLAAADRDAAGVAR